ncbi:hypothetical protein UA45_13525 [Morganella morganii]|uniref:Uncharacterized protein n=1 Tax=Morganella morganii TaxID=582 RepID=A0A0D8L969_MORMO|nr:hypothetical protein UA45_13525 [Morganella morganii]
MLIRVTGGCTAAEPVITVLNFPAGKIGLTDNLPGFIPLIAVFVPGRINHCFQPCQAVIFKADLTFTVKVLNRCLVLIPDSEDIRAMKQQNQQQQAQLTTIRHTMRKLMTEYISG